MHLRALFTWLVFYKRLIPLITGKLYALVSYKAIPFIYQVFVLTVLLFSGVASISFAQGKVTISGTVRAGDSGENLVGVAVQAPGLQAGTSTNTYGFYSLSVPPGTHTVVYSYVGYQTLRREVNVIQNTKLNIELPVST